LCGGSELLLGQPLFPGESNVDQLVEIIKVPGTAPDACACDSCACEQGLLGAREQGLLRAFHFAWRKPRASFGCVTALGAPRARSSSVCACLYLVAGHWHGACNCLAVGVCFDVVFVLMGPGMARRETKRVFACAKLPHPDWCVCARWCLAAWRRGWIHGTRVTPTHRWWARQRARRSRP